MFSDYEKEYVEGKDVVDCGGANTGSPVPNEIREQKQACRIDLDSWAGNTPCIKQRDFGFEEGRPCLALKMNKVCWQTVYSMPLGLGLPPSVGANEVGEVHTTLG